MTKNKKAVLVLDHQNLLINSYVKQADQYLLRLKLFLDGVRKQKVPIIFVTVGFRLGFPEISDKNKIFRSVRDGGRFLDTDDGSQIPELIIERDSDLVIKKHRVSAFEGTELQVILRAQGVSKIILFGVITSGVVLSTVRQAADLDYELTVLEDFCHDPSPDVQEVLLRKILPMQSSVVTSDECLKLLDD